jgi:ferredoxin-2, mitochondrial
MISLSIRRSYNISLLSFPRRSLYCPDRIVSRIRQPASTTRAIVSSFLWKWVRPPGSFLSAKSSIRWHGDSSVPEDAPTVSVTFLQPEGTTRLTVSARVGESLLETAHRHEIDLEGACEGVCACSTCHLILPQSLYDSLPEPSEEEEDMLDMAFGLTETSRLGCQVKVRTDMDGVTVEMPKATRNFYVDGHKPKPH